MNRTSTSQVNNSTSMVVNLLYTFGILLFFLLFSTKAWAQPCPGLACKGQVNISLADNGSYQLTPSVLMAGPIGCPALGTVDITYNGNSIGNTVNCTHVGQLLKAKFTHNNGNSCWSNILIEDKLGPKIDCKDVTVNCIEAATVTSTQPAAVDNCTSVVSLTSGQQTTQNFGCGTTTITDFNGPYEMWKWTMKNPNGGNGTVDKTFMPSQLTIKGAVNQVVKTNPRYLTQYCAPAVGYGYVKFNWMTSGWGNPNVDAFYFSVNDTCVQLTKTGVMMGSFTSWYIKPGDIIRFEQASQGGVESLDTKITNFQFIGDVQQIITRTWFATDAHGNTRSCQQNVHVKALTGSTFIFPKNLDDVSAPSLNCGANNNTTPAATGWPKLDKDGNLATTNDQIDISQPVNNCVSVSYQDQTTQNCPGSSTIMRNWTILEHCTNIPQYKLQIIKIKDKTAPVIACPANITIGANLPNCKANVVLPTITATDDCSGVQSVTASWKFGNGMGVNHVASSGVNVVTYTATDKCGNTSTCTMTVTVLDNEPPVVVAKANLVVSLTSNGMAFIAATVFNEGSSDNCCLDKFEVKRMDAPAADPFAPQVKFQCDDAGKTIIVILKVWDCNGNSNTAMVNVQVQDKLAPTFTFCPPNVTVDCGTDLTSLTKYGTPTITDDCTFTTMYVETPNVNNQCGTGTVTRTWTATDNTGKTSVCTQTITVKNNSFWNTSGTKIVWPQDYTVTACSGNNPLDPNSLPFPYNRPSFKDLNGCTNPLGSFEDKNFALNGGTCFKILRKWTIIDWCQYDPNNPNAGGRWEYTQTLNVMDNMPPDLTIPKDTVVLATDKDCKSTLVTFPKVTAKDCSPNVQIINNFNTNGDNATGVYPYGTTIVKFTANDGCGNMSVREMKVTVKDGKKPTPICHHGLSTTITPTNGTGNGGEAWIFASMFNAGSYDNCTSSKKLKVSFSTNVTDTMKMYTCDSLGVRQIRFWVTDESGNQDYCDTYIEVQNNMGACSNGGTQMFTVAGKIATEELKDVEKVNLKISMPGTTSLVTDATGKFLFKNIPGGNYKVTPEKDINHINGVSTYDLYLMNRHILGLQLLPSAYKIIAADVDKNNKVTVSDVNELRKLILGVYTALPNNTSWRFIPKSFVFPTPTTPFASAFPELLDMQISQNKVNNDFVGFKVGDLNANAVVNTLIGDAGSRSGKTNEVIMENTAFVKNQIVRIPFTISQLSEISAMQFTFGFDQNKFELINLEEGNVKGFEKDAFGFQNIRQGLITASWFKETENIKDNDVLFYLNVRAKESGSLADALTLDSRIATAEAYDLQGTTANITLKFNGITESPFAVYQNQPNPFNGTTTIAYQMPENADVTLKIFNTAGEIVKIYNQNAAKGFNQFTIEKDDLGVQGVLMYRLESGKYQATKKMIVMP